MRASPAPRGTPRGPHVDVEQVRVRQRDDAHVGRDPSLDREQQRRAAGPGRERRSVVRQHALEERRPVGADGADERAEAEVDEGRTVAQRGVLRFRVGTEPCRQDDAAVVLVHRAARGEVRVQRALGHSSHAMRRRLP
jgi:hypothetical protein